MKILFLGTGAADWPPEKNGDGEHRRYSSALIDGTLLIDPGPSVPDALAEYGIDPSDIKYVINTHRQRDHFSEQTLRFLEEHGATFYPTHSGDEITLDNYTVKALPAHHRVETCHFLITERHSQKKLFYALDGAWLLYAEVAAVIDASPVDYAVLDATIGFIDGDFRIFEHNNLAMVLEMKKTLGKHIKQFCISHMAMTLHTDHKTLTDEMAKHGIEVAYDGFCKEV